MSRTVDLTRAFPSALRPDVDAVRHVMPTTIGSVSEGGVHLNWGGDWIAIPYRLAHPEPATGDVDGLSSAQRRILHCLYTRHDDGWVRQRHLEQVVLASDPWVIPFVVLLVGEYVVEIVERIDRALPDLDLRAYRAFASANPDLMELVGQRVASYWSYYHRHRYPQLRDYPGRRFVAALRGR
jgi:hypothetical protein